MPNKKGKEARVERATWFAMILVFVLLRFDRSVTYTEFLVPISLGIILLVSGTYQITQKWPVSPFTWMFGAVLVLAGITTILPYFTWFREYVVLVSLGITVAFIVIGIISNEG